MAECLEMGTIQVSEGEQQKLILNSRPHDCSAIPFGPIPAYLGLDMREERFESLYPSKNSAQYSPFASITECKSDQVPAGSCSGLYRSRFTVSLGYEPSWDGSSSQSSAFDGTEATSQSHGDHLGHDCSLIDEVLPDILFLRQPTVLEENEDITCSLDLAHTTQAGRMSPTSASELMDAFEACQVRPASSLPTGLGKGHHGFEIQPCSQGSTGLVVDWTTEDLDCFHDEWFDKPSVDFINDPSHEDWEWDTKKLQWRFRSRDDDGSSVYFPDELD